MTLLKYISKHGFLWNKLEIISMLLVLLLIKNQGMPNACFQKYSHFYLFILDEEKFKQF